MELLDFLVGFFLFLLYYPIHSDCLSHAHLEWVQAHVEHCILSVYFFLSVCTSSYLVSTTISPKTNTVDTPLNKCIKT